MIKSFCCVKIIFQDWGVAQLVEFLPSIHEALHSISALHKNKQWCMSVVPALERRKQKFKDILNSY